MEICSIFIVLFVCSNIESLTEVTYAEVWGSATLSYTVQVSGTYIFAFYIGTTSANINLIINGTTVKQYNSFWWGDIYPLSLDVGDVVVANGGGRALCKLYLAE